VQYKQKKEANKKSQSNLITFFYVTIRSKTKCKCGAFVSLCNLSGMNFDDWVG